MIAAVPVEWGAVRTGETEHAWIFNTASEHGRRISLCEHIGDAERWTAPVPSTKVCDSCRHRAGGCGSLLDLDPLLRFLAARHPYTVSMSDLSAKFTFLNQRTVRKVVVQTVVDLGFAARITSPGYGERLLALKPLRDRLGMRRWTT